MRTPEGKVKAKVKRDLKVLHSEDGYSVWQFWPVQMGLGATALDCLFAVNGQFCAIETKKKGGKMTPRQEQVATDMHNAGIIVFVVDDDASLAHAMKSIRKQCKEKY